LATIAKERHAKRIDACIRCHAPSNSDFRFCPSCGAPIDRPPMGLQSSPPEPILVLDEEQTGSEEIDTIFA